MSEAESESHKWKERYLESLDEIEDSKKRFETELDTLRRGLVRVSLVADGVDKRLDTYLSKLRDTVRRNSEVSEIELVIEKVDTLLRELDEGRRASQESTQVVFEQMLESLLGLGSNRAIKKKVKEFEKQVRSLIDKSDNHGLLVQQYSKIQEEVLSEFGGKEEKTKGGFWKKIVSGNSEANDDEPENRNQNQEKAANAIPESSDGDDWEIAEDESSEELNQSGDIQKSMVLEHEAIKERIAGVLIAFIDQVTIPSYLASRETKVRDMLKAGFPWPELPETLSESVSLLIGSNTEAQKEFEGFLLTLNARLLEIHQLFEQSQKNQSSNVENSKNLSNTLKSTITEIQHSVENSTDILSLKKNISQQLDSITQAMDSYNHQVEENTDDIFSRIKSLGERMEAMEQEANQMRSTIEEQRKQTMKDGLTALPNRTAYAEYTEKELARSQRHNLELSLIVCDIDHFKSINDTFGHLSGDKVLKLVAGCIEKSLRVSDFVARYGGEEFVILMPETPLEAARLATEKVRAAIDNCAFHFKAKPVNITASFGVAQLRGDEAIETLFDRADKALYQAKQTGRNKVCLEAQSVTDDSADKGDENENNQKAG